MQHEATNAEHDEPMNRSSAQPPAALLCGLAIVGGLSLLAAAFVWPPWEDYRRTPRPEGTVLQHELSATTTNIVAPFDVFAIDDSGPAIAVLERNPEGANAILWVLRYPTAEVLSHVMNPSESDVGQLRAKTRVDGASFDFDGDGCADTLDAPKSRDASVEVTSGRDQRVLYRYDDACHDAPEGRGFPLGDLDGDGCAELALLHPRRDRSKFDFEFADQLLGAKSWISIISGKLATH